MRSSGQLHRIGEEENTPSMRCSHRGPGDDFFCLRYQVWYASLDCAIRSRFRTCTGCLDCEQGRFNLKRHRAALSRSRLSWSGAHGE